MSWFPQQWKKCIVSIENKEYLKDEKGNFQVYSPIGTAFIINYENYNFIVTCKHIAEQFNGMNIFFCLNKKQGGIMRIPLERLNEDWFIADNHKVDIAINFFPIDKNKMDIIPLSLDLSEKFKNLYEGDETFFLGFPLGIRDENKINPVFRPGVVSFKDEEREIIYLDANIFPGSSGSPVFLKPTPFSFKDGAMVISTNPKPAKFIGLISNFIPYSDRCVSTQTNRERIVFEENSGLGELICFDEILKIIKSKEFLNDIRKIEKGGKR